MKILWCKRRTLAYEYIYLFILSLSLYYIYYFLGDERDPLDVMTRRDETRRDEPAFIFICAICVCLLVYRVISHLKITRMLRKRCFRNTNSRSFCTTYLYAIRNRFRIRMMIVIKTAADGRGWGCDDDDNAAMAIQLIFRSRPRCECKIDILYREKLFSLGAKNAWKRRSAQWIDPKSLTFINTTHDSHWIERLEVYTRVSTSTE